MFKITNSSQINTFCAYIGSKAKLRFCQTSVILLLLGGAPAILQNVTRKATYMLYISPKINAKILVRCQENVTSCGAIFV